MKSSALHDDPRVHNAVIAFRSALSEICRTPRYKGRLREDAVRDIGFKLRRFKCEGIDAGELLESLLAAKVVIEKKGRVLPASRASNRSKEEKQASFDGWVDVVSERATGDANARGLLATLIRRMTRLHGVHRIRTRFGAGFLIASEMDFVLGIPTITAGRAVIIGERRIRTFDLDSYRIAVTWAEDWPVLAADVTGLRPRKANDDLMTMRLVGETGLYTISDTTRMSEHAYKRLLEKRSDIEAFIGVELTGTKWNGLRMSLRRAKPLLDIARRAMLGMIDHDARKIALRNPFATYEFYYWLRNADAETVRRRRQMSDAFPLFTSRIRKLDDVIREGRPLLPAIEALTGLDIPRLKKLRGMHWQRMGFALRALVVDDDEYESVNLHLRQISPERYPSNRMEWKSFVAVSHWEVIKWLPEDKKLGFVDAASRNWNGYADLAARDLAHAVKDTAKNLVTLVDHHYSTGMRGQKVTSMLCSRIFTHIAGDYFGLKRLRAFNEAWHKGTGARSLKLRAVKHGVFGEDRIATWEPLTSAGFKCASGNLVWLTDENQLVEEGEHMHHCVGSYWSHCVSGVSHIAQIHGFDGSRSTVELHVSNKGKLSVAQHHTYYDKPPSDACKGVVSKFLSANAKKTFAPVEGDPGTKHQESEKRRVGPDMVAIVREAYADCLPSSFLDGLEAWGSAWRQKYPDMAMEIAEAVRMNQARRSSATASDDGLLT
ncbi:hypothetical protein G6L37_05745 [Agrobacterium rubi]|nr:hypothetical protein [Agrobacterium rubi]NTF24862.1 hypothetical protein [Agrobacterium rubi]